MVEIQRIRAESGEELRDIRLTALQESPSAFGSTFAAESDQTAAEWSERARLGAEGHERVTFLARDGAQAVGLVGGYREERSVHLVSMWVAPTHRRRGIGRDLVTAVLEWADAAGALSVSLWVTRANDAAHELYESMGFVDTDDVQPLPSDPCKDEVRMIREQSRRE